MKVRASIFEPKWLLVFVFFVAGIFLGGLALYLWLNVPDISGGYKIHQARSQYKYINPLLAVDLYGQEKFVKNKSLELELEALVNDAKKKGVSGISVYFRDIEPGLWAAINDTEKFSPGKLLKIPIMIAYFKLAEINPEILNKKLVFDGKDIGLHKDEVFTPKDALKIGEAYAVEDLIHRMIVNYDDNAADLLFDNIDKDSLNEVFSDLGIEFKEDKQTQDFISLKIYSLFFRVLYNATYLNRDFSEKALSLLDEADNSVGLGAALPKDLAISNRYGGRVFAQNNARFFEMYDCGIVYYPEHPYLLCATAESANLTDLKDFLKELGKTVFAEISYEYAKQ